MLRGVAHGWAGYTAVSLLVYYLSTDGEREKQQAAAIFQNDSHFKNLLSSLSQHNNTHSRTHE